MSDSEESMDIDYEHESLEKVISQKSSMDVTSEASSTHLTGLSNINVPSPRSSPQNVDYHSSSESSEAENQTRGRKRKKDTAGKRSGANFREMVYPQHPGRLFARILNCKDIDIIMTFWINEYRIDKEKAILQMYQLFIDVSTYQHIDITNFIQRGENINNLVKYLENSNNTFLDETGKFFLFIRNKTHLMKIKKIDDFIERFVALCSKEKILYEFDLFHKLVNVLIQMSNSLRRSIKHTGVYFALKFQTGIVHVSTKIAHKMTNLIKYLESDQPPEVMEELESKLGKLKNYDNEVNKIIIYLQANVLNKNVGYLDPKMYFMRQDCLAELYTWIKMFPQRYLHNENLNHFVTAIADSNKLVRYSAIEFVGKIVENYEPIIHSKLPKLIAAVAIQINDIDMNVQVLAIDTLTIFRRYIPIPSNIREILCKNIYNVKYPVAAACGRYLAEHISRNMDDEGQLRLLIHFAKKSGERGFAQRYPGLVEAMYDCFPVLQNVKLFMKILEVNDFSKEDLDLFLDILTETVKQTFTGKSSIQRISPRNGPIIPEVVKTMWEDVYNSFRILVNYYSLEELAPLIYILRDNKPKKTAVQNTVSVTNSSEVFDLGAVEREPLESINLESD